MTQTVSSTACPKPVAASVWTGPGQRMGEETVRQLTEEGCGAIQRISVAVCTVKMLLGVTSK